MSENPQDEAVEARYHAVQFYGNDAALVSTVGGFLGEGLVAGQPAIVIATAAHVEAIAAELARRLIDVAEARRLGDLVCLDAEETLGAFMVGDLPDEPLFEHHVGSLIDQTLRGRERVSARAYGEMVDLLWKRGQTQAAVRLEIFWNRLAAKHAFALLCGYSMGNFYKETERLFEVRAQHTEVVGSHPRLVPFERRSRTRPRIA